MSPSSSTLTTTQNPRKKGTLRAKRLFSLDVPRTSSSPRLRCREISTCVGLDLHLYPKCVPRPARHTHVYGPTTSDAVNHPRKFPRELLTSSKDRSDTFVGGNRKVRFQGHRQEQKVDLTWTAKEGARGSQVLSDYEYHSGQKGLMSGIELKRYV